MTLPVRLQANQLTNLLAQYLRPQWRKMLLLAVFLFSSIGLQLLTPQILRQFIDAATSTEPADALAGAALWFIALGIAGKHT